MFKKAMAAGVLSLGFSVSAFAVPTGTVVYYSMDSADTSGTTILDTSGSTTVHNGTLPGGATHVDGKVGEAIQFNINNTNDILIPDAGEINTSTTVDRTVSLWFNADNTSLRQVLFEEGGSTHGLNLYIFNGQVYAGQWANSGSSANYLSADIEADQWYHLAFVLDGTADTFNAYLNGALIGSAAGFDVPAHADDVAIGGRRGLSRFENGASSGNGQNDNAFGGEIDEFYLINAALSQDEIQALIPEPTTAVLGLMGFAGLAFRRRRNA